MDQFWLMPCDAYIQNPFLHISSQGLRDKNVVQELSDILGHPGICRTTWMWNKRMLDVMHVFGTCICSPG